MEKLIKSFDIIPSGEILTIVGNSDRIRVYGNRVELRNSIAPDKFYYKNYERVAYFTYNGMDCPIYNSVY